jgi:hypothetical protein
MLRYDIESTSDKETIMNRPVVRTNIILAISIALLTGAAGLKWVATAQQRQGLVFIAGDRPVTEDQVRSKLQAEGWSNVQIEREGKYFGVSAMKNGQSGRLAIDSETAGCAPTMMTMTTIDTKPSVPPGASSLVGGKS